MLVARIEKEVEDDHKVALGCNLKQLVCLVGIVRDFLPGIPEPGSFLFLCGPCGCGAGVLWVVYPEWDAAGGYPAEKASGKVF